MAFIFCLALFLFCYTLIAAFHLILSIMFPKNFVQIGGMDSANIAPLRAILCIVIPSWMCLRAWRKRSLKKSALVPAFVLGFVLTAASYAYVAMMLVFFLLSSRLSKFRSKQKAFLTPDVQEGEGNRDWRQVTANGGMALLIALLSLCDGGFGSERPIDFGTDYSSACYDTAMLGAVASVAGDTWASELGSVLGSTPWLLTTLAPVPRGTNGGVSVLGTLASGLGGGSIGLVHWLCIRLLAPPSPVLQYPLIFLGVAFGLFGSLFDSFLGATLQYSGINSEGKVVEDPAHAVKHIAGYHVLHNDTVNFLTSFCCTLLCPVISFHLWGADLL